MSNATKSTKQSTKERKRGYKKVSLEQVAYVASKFEGPFTINDMIEAGIPRCAVSRATEKSILKVLKAPVNTGRRGRPAAQMCLNGAIGKSYLRRLEKDMANAEA